MGPPLDPLTAELRILCRNITLAKQLRTLQAQQLDEYRKRITALFNSHPDRDCFGSLPGAGEKIAQTAQ